MFQNGKICPNRKNITENEILDFIVRAEKFPQKCKHDFHATLFNALTECAKLEKISVKKKNLEM